MSDGTNPISRKDIRRALGDGLAANMPTAQAIYRYQKSDLKGQSPVVRVFSARSLRPQKTGHGGVRSQFGFVVQLWVLYAGDGIQNWSEEGAEDTLDQLEYELISWMVQNQGDQVGTLWTSLKYGGWSVVDNVKVAGNTYLVEDVPVIAEVFG